MGGGSLWGLLPIHFWSRPEPIFGKFQFLLGEVRFLLGDVRVLLSVDPPEGQFRTKSECSQVKPDAFLSDARARLGDIRFFLSDS